MPWKSIRLELARTREFPQGSASRAYILRLPLSDEGLIEEAEVRACPSRAAVRRFWPNQADMNGRVIRTGNGWAFRYEPGEEDDEAIYHLDTHPIRLGEYITLTEPDGRRLPFRVASVAVLP